MGTTLEARCKCGYVESAMVASGRRDHGKVFFYPHACDDCSAMVSIDILKSPVVCPTCGSSNVKSYGVAIKELPFGRWNRFKAWLSGDKKRHAEQKAAVHRKTIDSSYCYRTHTTYVIPTDPATCPACKEKSLVFESTVLFD